MSKKNDFNIDNAQDLLFEALISCDGTPSSSYISMHKVRTLLTNINKMGYEHGYLDAMKEKKLI